jgi:hypothetical protein
LHLMSSKRSMKRCTAAFSNIKSTKNCSKPRKYQARSNKPAPI